MLQTYGKVINLSITILISDTFTICLFFSLSENIDLKNLLSKVMEKVVKIIVVSIIKKKTVIERKYLSPRLMYNHIYWSTSYYHYFGVKKPRS